MNLIQIRNCSTEVIRSFTDGQNTKATPWGHFINSDILTQFDLTCNPHLCLKEVSSTKIQGAILIATGKAEEF